MSQQLNLVALRGRIVRRLPEELVLWLHVAKLARKWGGVGNVEIALTGGAHWPWGGPLNGQTGRQDLVRALAKQVAFDYAVETGTWRGGSTSFLADVLGCSVWTVEADPTAYRFACQVLSGRPDIRLQLGDSRAFLREASRWLDTTAPVFFYLDAHWDPGDLPLWEEIRQVFAHWSRPVVMVDDRAVPGDEGYAFDDYGPGRALTLDVLGPHVPAGVCVLFPTLPSAEETGAKRGCCVLVRDAMAGDLAGDLLAHPA